MKLFLRDPSNANDYFVQALHNYISFCDLGIFSWSCRHPHPPPLPKTVIQLYISILGVSRLSVLSCLFPLVIRSLLGAFHWIDIAPSTKNLSCSGKGLMLPSKFCLKGIVFFSLLFFFFLLCKQLLKGIVNPLAVKAQRYWI